MKEASRIPLVDSHAHVDHLADEHAVIGMLARARAAGLVRIVAIGGNEKANARAVAVARAEPGLVRAAVGYDRDQAGSAPDDGTLCSWLDRPEVVAIGEIGLDYFYGRDTRAQQIVLFERMLERARRVRKPVVVHSRDADDDTIRLLRDHVRDMRDRLPHPGVVHCFTGNVAFAEQLLDLGMMIGFSGIITFKNAGALRAVAKALPEDRLLVETDAPYLAPVPVRGKQNEPAYVAHVVAGLAEIRGDTVEHIAHSTTRNAMNLFEPARERHE